MSTTDTPYLSPARRFATTRWSLVVEAARRRNEGSTRLALQELCTAYWQPVYSYIRHRGNGPEEAQDLTQEFFARLIERNPLERADKSRGRFRTFLLASVTHFLHDEHDRASAQKRGGTMQFVPLEFEHGENAYVREPTHNGTPEQVFEKRWALTLLARVMDMLREEYERTNRAELFTHLQPCLAGDRDALPYADIAAALSTTEGAVKAAVHRMRKTYRNLLRQEIAQTVLAPDEVEEELNDLFRIFAR